MGAVADAVTSVANTVVDTVSSVGTQAVQAVQDAGQAVIDNVAKPVVQAVDNTIKAAEADPLGTALRVATAVTIQDPTLLMAANTSINVAEGQPIDKAITSAGIQTVAAQAGQQVSGLESVSDLGPTASKSIGAGTAGATNAVLQGKDPVTGAASALINSAANSELNNLVNGPSTSGGLPTTSSTEDTYTPTTDYTSGADYSLSSTTPSLGLQATLEPSIIPDDGSPIDYGLNVAPASGVDGGGLGLQPSESPNIKNMNGAQGLTATDSGGTYSALGYTPSDASPNLGDPNSFINDPNVLGNAVAQTDTTLNIPLPNVNVAGALGIGDSSSKTNPSTTPSSNKSGTTQPAVTGALASTPLSLNAFLPSFMNTGTSELKGAPIYSKSTQIANKLREITGGNLTPELVSVLTSRGIISPDVADQILQEDQTPYESQTAQANPTTFGQDLKNLQYTTKFMSTGGSPTSDTAMSQIGFELDNQNIPISIKNAKPSMIGAAPVIPTQSHLGTLNYLWKGIKPQRPSIIGQGGLAHGGMPARHHPEAPKGHHPEFITGETGYYAAGKGTGQSDDIPAMLKHGDYVMDADTVAALGDGSSKAGGLALEQLRRRIPAHHSEGGTSVPAQIADGEYVLPAEVVTSLGGGDNARGAKILDKMREEVRAHKRSAPTSKIPPKAKSPLEYIKMASKG